MRLPIQVWLKMRIVTKQEFIVPTHRQFRLDPPQCEVSEMNKIIFLSDKEKEASASPPAVVCQFWLSELREQMLPKEDICPWSSASRDFSSTFPAGHRVLGLMFSDVICLHQKHIGCILNILPALWEGYNAHFKGMPTFLINSLLLHGYSLAVSGHQKI